MPKPALPSAEEYPTTWVEFLDQFSSEDACARYLEKVRWPNGFTCPRCGVVAEPYRSSRGRMMCRGCRIQTTVTAGTILDKTRTSLRVWLAAMWYVTNQKHGVSALGLQRVLGFGSYQTAWAILHRLRRAMVRPGRDQLHGDVEVDETHVAITDIAKTKAGRGIQSNTLDAIVVIAIERLETKGFGRIRLRRVLSKSSKHILPFIREVVAPGSRVCTDGSGAYLELTADGFVHQKNVLLGSDQPAHAVLPGVHRVAALLQRWLLGTHHGAVHAGHLDSYLDEFVFRFNRRTSRSRGLLFYRLVEQAVATAPATYEKIVKSKRL